VCVCVCVECACETEREEGGRKEGMLEIYGEFLNLGVDTAERRLV
jgi:hypothetical protein